MHHKDCHDNCAICCIAKVVKCYCECLPEHVKPEHKKIICCVAEILESACTL